jgi:hypothetical protein
MSPERKQMATNSPIVEIKQPRLFTMGAVLTVTAYGLFLLASVLVSILMASLIQLGIQTVLIPFAVLAGAAYFRPFGQGNTYINQLVRSFSAAAASGEEGFVVQLTFSPRIRSGLRATLEDADDVGWLSFGESGLVFAGDSVKLSIPYDCIERVQPRNIGLRGGFIYGRRIKVVAGGLPEPLSLEFVERSSLVLPASRRITRQLYECLAAKVPPASKEAAAQEASA